MEKTDCLLLALQPRLQGAIVPKETVYKSALSIAQVRYDKWEDNDQSINEGGWTGHFDWLKSDEATVIGVRYYPRSESVYSGKLVKLLPSHPYLSVTDYDTFCIYFGTATAFVPELSDHADFGNNFIYLSKKGQILISFPLYNPSDGGLTPTDVLAIKNSAIEWSSALAL